MTRGSEIKNIDEKFVNYEAETKCRNCGSSQKISIPKGQAIEKTPCPNCGCNMIERKDRYSIQ